VREFCGLYHNGYGWQYNGATNTEDLHNILVNSVMIRRLKKDVLKELPPKMRTPVLLDIDNSSDYRAAQRNLIEWLKDKDGVEAAERAAMAEHIVRIEKLKQLAVEGKMKSVVSWVFDFLQGGEKLVLFTTHKKTIQQLHNAFRSVKIDGSMSSAQRQVAVNKFQNDPNYKLLIGNIKAAGIGFTLTAASNAAFIEYPWTPGELVQAEDRVHRMGQKATSVNIWHLVARNTIEESIIRILDSKAKVLSKVLDGGRHESSSALTAIINELKERA
jgi:SWI/SNF-related matrix-associated actin-dependent regulator 1 of chromatin subfamily A